MAVPFENTSDDNVPVESSTTLVAASDHNASEEDNLQQSERPKHHRNRRNRRASDEQVKYDGRMVWVSKDSAVGEIAKQITYAALPGSRNGFPVYLFSKFDHNTNMAVKAVVKASSHLSKLQPPIYVATIPSFRTSRNELTFKVIRLDEPRAPLADDSPLLSVAGSTDPKVLAGAIAKHLRDGTALSIRGIGSKAIFELYRAIAICRLYLDSDGQGVDVLTFAGFVEVKLETREDTTSALHVEVIPVTTPQQDPAPTEEEE